MRALTLGATFLGTLGLCGVLPATPAAGDPLFGTRHDYLAGNSPSSVAVTDLNMDGWPDLVVANAGSSTLSILLATGNGAFGTRHDLPTSYTPDGVAAGDFNRDGFPDLAAACAEPIYVSVYLGSGDGTFGPRHDWPTGWDPEAVAVADVNGTARSTWSRPTGGGTPSPCCRATAPAASAPRSARM